MLWIVNLPFWAHLTVQTLRRRVRQFRITLAATVLSVATLVFVCAMVRGVSDTMVANAVSVQAGHVLLSWGAALGMPQGLARRLEALPGVRAVLSRSRCVGLLRSPAGRPAYCQLYGVQPAMEARHTVVAGKMIAGRYVRAAGEIILGAACGESLGVEVGQLLEFHGASGARVQFLLVGIFRTHLREMDLLMAYTDIAEAPADSREMSLFLDDAELADAVSAAAVGLAPCGARVDPWRRLMPDLVQLVGLQQTSTSLIVVLVLAILAFGVASATFVSVSDRMRELGVLKAMGLRPRAMVLMVLAETLLLSGIGSLGGMGLGAAASAAVAWAGGIDLDAWTSSNPLFVGGSRIWPRLSAWGLLWPPAVATAASLLAGLMPALRAGRVSVAQTLRDS